MQAYNPGQPEHVNLYEVLGLTPPTARSPSPATIQDIRAAYRRALLKYHPDKLIKENSTSALADLRISRLVVTPNAPSLTIDQITHAFQVLSVPERRRQYDAQLRSQLEAQLKSVALQNQTTELDVVDLDDMNYHGDSQLWTKTCRCGNDEGFCVTEDVLITPEASSQGEVLLGCADCSHHVKVLYHIEVED